MAGVEHIQKDGVDYAIIVRKELDTGEKYNFIAPNHFAFQLGVNFYGAGETIRAHHHLPRTYTTSMFQELVLVAEGRLKMTLYDESHVPFGVWTLEAGDCVLLAKGGHGFEVEANTKIIEVKQGPFDPSVPHKALL